MKTYFSQFPPNATLKVVNAEKGSYFMSYIGQTVQLKDGQFHTPDWGYGFDFGHAEFELVEDDLQETPYADAYTGPTATVSEDVSEGLVTLKLSKQDAANLSYVLRFIIGHDGPNGLRDTTNKINAALRNAGINNKNHSGGHIEDSMYINSYN